MQKTKLIITGAVAGAIATAGTAYAAGENVVSSKAYVDSGISQKQGIISKVDNANTVMLFPTTTGGTPGARAIQTSLGNDTNLVTRSAVNTALNAKQEIVHGVSDAANKVVLYNSNGGLSGTDNPAKGVYNASTAYTGQGGNLIEAQHLNAAIANGFNAHLTCANPPDCTLWTMNQLNASTNTYVPQTVPATSGN